MTGFEISRAFYVRLAELEDMQINYKPHHASLYKWICEVKNRIRGDLIGLPRDYTMEQTAIGSPTMLATCIEDLERWGLIKIVSKGNRWNRATQVKIDCSFMNSDQTLNEHSSNLDRTQIELTMNTFKTSKRNKTSKPKTTSIDAFSLFWDTYDKKVDRKTCESKFNGLSAQVQQAILAHVSDYVKVHPDPKYRKNPETYLNRECWKDPLIASTNQAGQPAGEKRLIV